MERFDHTSCLFEPKLDLITIRVRDICERKARCKLALSEKLAARAFYLCNGSGQVFRPPQSKPEVSDATGGACLLGRAFECQDVERTRPLDLNLTIVAEVLAHSEGLGIELQGLLRVAYCKADVGKTVSFKHEVAPGVSWGLTFD